MTLKEPKLSLRAYREVLSTQQDSAAPEQAPAHAMVGRRDQVLVPGVRCSEKLWFNFCPEARACQEPQDPPPGSVTMCTPPGT